MERMKKVFAALVASAMLVLAMAAVSFAANSPGSAPVPATKITVAKTSNMTNYKKSSSFSLGAKASDGSKLTYSSNSKKVTVTSDGKVKVAKGFIGEAKITIKAGKVTKTVTVKINPRRVKLVSATSPKKGQAKATWNTSKKVTGYEVQYATNKKFSKAVTKILKKNTTSKKIAKSLKKGTCYVRIRTYKVVNGKKYYSTWSHVEKTTVK